jgi:P-type conjugative transfer protein TrbJ
MKKTLIAIAAAVLMTVMPSVQATVVVIDPANLIQNILTAARTLQQINNQIQQLQNEAQMLTNQAKNLTSLPFSALNQLQSALSATNQLLQQAQGLSLNLTQMETQFAQLYPAAYTASTPANQMALDASQRWQNSLEALRTAAEVQSQSVQNFTSDEQTLSDLRTAASRRSALCKPRRRRTSCWLCKPGRRSRRSNCRSRKTAPSPSNRRGRSRCMRVPPRCATASMAPAHSTPYTVNYYGN